MRIAIVSPEFPPDIGGVETYAFEYVKELASRGHEVTVFTVRHARGEADLPGARIEPWWIYSFEPSSDVNARSTPNWRARSCVRSCNFWEP